MVNVVDEGLTWSQWLLWSSWMVSWTVTDRVVVGVHALDRYARIKRQQRSTCLILIWIYARWSSLSDSIIHLEMHWSCNFLTASTIDRCCCCPGWCCSWGSCCICWCCCMTLLHCIHNCFGSNFLLQQLPHLSLLAAVVASAPTAAVTLFALILQKMNRGWNDWSAVWRNNSPVGRSDDCSVGRSVCWTVGQTGCV